MKAEKEKYGKRVIFEFNKMYPVVMVPMIEEAELTTLFKKILQKYRGEL
jgi:hypothetical protein